MHSDALTLTSFGVRLPTLQHFHVRSDQQRPAAVVERQAPFGCAALRRRDIVDVGLRLSIDVELLFATDEKSRRPGD